MTNIILMLLAAQSIVVPSHQHNFGFIGSTQKTLTNKTTCPMAGETLVEITQRNGKLFTVNVVNKLRRSNTQDIALIDSHISAFNTVKEINVSCQADGSPFIAILGISGNIDTYQKSTVIFQWSARGANNFRTVRSPD